MWHKAKSERFQYLRGREANEILTLDEQAELALLADELETEEASYLKPATARIQAERLELEGQNRALAALADRRERLLVRLQQFLNEVQTERRAIDTEVARVLSPATSSSGAQR